MVRVGQTLTNIIPIAFQVKNTILTFRVNVNYKVCKYNGSILNIYYYDVFNIDIGYP